MGISDFFSAIAGNMKDHYLNLARSASAGRTPEHYKVPAPTRPTAEAGSVDRFEPSATAPKETPEEDTPLAESEATREQPLQQNPDGTYYYRRSARLDYLLNLQFDLGAVVQTASRIAEKDTATIRQLVAGNFGFHADFALMGKQTVATNMPAEDDTSAAKGRAVSRTKTRQAGLFRAQSRNFKVQSFQRDASTVRRSLNVRQHGEHRRTVNKFSLRFRTDSSFSFAFANRFNIQTERVAAERPDQIGSYMQSAGDIALKGSSEMMTTFFDGVEAFLKTTEDGLLQNVVEAFDTAAAELGFSGAMVDTARAQLEQTIENFFDRVTITLEGIESLFQPTQPSMPGMPEPAALQQTAVAADTNHLAVA